MNSIEKEIFTLRGFAKYSKTKKSLEALKKLLLKENSSNVEAIYPVGNLEVKEVDISDLVWTEDFDIITGYFYVNGLQYTEEEMAEELNSLKEAIAGLEEKIFQIEDSIDDSYEELKTYERCSPSATEHSHFVNPYDNKISNLEKKLKNAREKLEDANDALYEFDNAEFRYDEVMWNTVFDYGSVDVELAQKCGLAVVDVQGVECVSIIGCGMDLSPNLIAYEALFYGYLSPEHARKLDRETNYCKYVMGEEIFDEVTEKLGIRQVVDDAIVRNNKRMELFDKTLNKLSVIRDSGEVADDSAVFLAVSALSDILS